MLKDQLDEDYGLFLDLASYMIVNEKNVGLHYPEYAYNHPLFSNDMRIYSDAKISRMLKSINKDKINGFLEKWNEGRDHNQQICVSYDSTNKNCQAGDVDMVELGHAKDKKSLPVFNVSVAFDYTNSVPLLYEVYQGSIPDVSQFRYMVDKILAYGYKHICFITDRGYFSKENLRYLIENVYSFIIVIKGRKKFVASLVDENIGSFETNRDCAIRSYRVYGKTVKARLYDEDEKERFIHIYFSPARQATEREEIEQQIDDCHSELEKFIGKKVELEKKYYEYFDITYDEDGNIISFVENKDFIEKQLKRCGYFCIVTSDEMTASEALIKYRSRDVVEKLFKTDKTFLGSKSAKVHSTETLSAKVFAEFIAMIIRNRIYTLLKEKMVQLNTHPTYMNVPGAIKELEKIEMVRLRTNRYQLDHSLSKRQKTILSSFGITEEDIRRSANEISKILHYSHPVIEEEESEEINPSVDLVFGDTD